MTTSTSSTEERYRDGERMRMPNGHLRNDRNNPDGFDDESGLC